MARRGLSDKTDKPKDIKYVLKRLWGYLMQYKLWLLAALVLTGAGNICALIGPSLSGRAIDAIHLEGTDFKEVGFYVVLMIILYILLSVLMIHVTRKIVFAMRRDAFNSLASLPVNYFDSNYAGNIIVSFRTI